MNTTTCVVTIQAAERESKVVEVKQKKIVRLIKFFNPSKRKKRALYVARLDRISRPPARKKAIDSFWQNVISQDLCQHMQKINNKILAHACNGTVSTRDSILMPELILTGQGSASPTCDLSLSPNIWLRCGSSQVKGWAKKEVGHMCWTRNYGLGDKIHVGLRAAVPASDPKFPVPPGLPLDSHGFYLPGDFTLFLHVERPTTTSALQPSGCGLICSITIKQGDKIVYNGCSRIGGILSIKKASGAVTLVGVTSGHALLDEFLSTNMETSDLQPRRRSGRIRSLLRRHGATASSSRGSIEPPTPAPPANTQSTPVTLFRTPSATIPRENFGTEKIQQREWDPVQSIYSLNWLGGGWETVKAFRPPFPVSRPEMLSSDSDFALLELPKDVANIFSLGNGPAMRVESLLLEKDMHEGDLHVVLGPGEAVPGTLLSERPSIFLRGRLFQTRKIQLERPLNLGVSGCWVVQRGGLCGMIALIYEDEPYAYMITAEKLVSDIEKTLGDKSKVSLPSDTAVCTLPLGMAVRTLPTTVSPTVEGGDEFSKPARPCVLFQEPDPPTPIATSPKRCVESHPIRQHPALGQLMEELTRALIQSPMDETKYFLPLSELDGILNFARVRVCLQHILPQIEDIQKLATYASGRGNKIFAILILIDRPERIIDFHLKQVLNHDLPLRRSNENGADFRLVRESDLRDARRGAGTTGTGLFDDWKSSEIRQFDDCQWYMIAPCINIFSDEMTLRYVYFHKRAILPFTNYDPCLGKGGFPNIYKARIHPAHHNLHKTTETDEVIIEVLDPRKVHFDQDIPTSSLSTIRPLTAFAFQGGYYLVLPWADGRGLYDLWAANPVPGARLSRIQAQEWVLEQCLGLAEGLAAIHRKKLPRKSEFLAEPSITAESFSERGKAVAKEPIKYGRHGDLKPENILWFRPKMLDDPTVGTELRILDAWPTTPQPPFQVAVAELTPYSAPDFDMEPTASHAPDIWALGCVYLEFITWLLLGYESVGEFARARMQDEADKSISDKTFFTQSRQHGGGLSTSLKPAVTNWFLRLRAHPNCTTDLASMLHYTKDKMLVIEPGRRSSAVAVTIFFRSLSTLVRRGAGSLFEDRYVSVYSRHPSSVPRVRYDISTRPQTVRSRSSEIAIKRDTKDRIPVPRPPLRSFWSLPKEASKSPEEASTPFRESPTLPEPGYIKSPPRVKVVATTPEDST